MEQETIWKQKENDNRNPYVINEYEDKEENMLSLNAKICCVQKMAHPSFMNEERKRSGGAIP